MDLIDTYTSEVNSFSNEMIKKFDSLIDKYYQSGYHYPQTVDGILGRSPYNKNGPSGGINTCQVYIDILKNGKTNSGFFRQGNCGVGAGTWPCNIDIPGLFDFSPNALKQFYESYKYALSHPGPYITSGQKNASKYFPLAYQKFTQFWDNLYSKTVLRLTTALTQQNTRAKKRAQATHGTGITWAPGWGPKPSNLPSDWQQQYLRMLDDIKKGAPDNRGALLAILQSGHDPLWVKFTSGKYKGFEYPVDPVQYAREHPKPYNPHDAIEKYDFTTYNWHESDKIAYTKDRKGNWILTESPSFDKIKKIILVWWNGDSDPVNPKFFFLTLYDKEKQEKEFEKWLKKPKHYMLLKYEYYYYGINPTLHMSLFGYADAAIYTVLTDGKIIAYGPLTDNSNENAISEYVSSIPTSTNPTVPSMFLIAPGDKILGRPPKPKNTPNCGSHASWNGSECTCKSPYHKDSSGNCVKDTPITNSKSTTNTSGMMWLVGAGIIFLFFSLQR